MSQQLSNVEIIEFKNIFQAFYQGSSVLDGTTTETHNITGGTWKVPRIGQVVLQERTQPQTPVVGVDPTQNFVTGTLKDYSTNIGIDKFQQLKTNVNSREAYARALAMAAGRRKDQQKFDVWAASATSNAIPAGGTNLTVAKLREASSLMNKNEVDQMDRHIVTTESQLDSLLAETEVTNSDFNTVKALVRGELNSFMGFKFHLIGSQRDSLEGGLPKTGNIRTCFAWQKRSTDMGFALDFELEIWLERLLKTTIVQVSLSANALEVLPEGIVKIDCDETA